MSSGSVADVLEGRAAYHVEHCRAEDFERILSPGSVHLMTQDQPYYGVKDARWDNAWPSPDAFLAWCAERLASWRPILAPNGSLYVFASADMGGRVECAVRNNFRVLNHIVWRKPDGSGAEKGARAGLTRSYIYQTERVMFAEQTGTSIGNVLANARRAAGLSQNELGVRMGYTVRGAPERSTGLTRWWETDPTVDGSCYPTREQYERAMNLCGAIDIPDYDDLMRPFGVSGVVPFSDVWDYPTVQHYDGKHECEKPEQMALDIISASSRPGDVVADFFCGSGVFLAAAVKLGRRAIGCDASAHWAQFSRNRCAMALATGRVKVRRVQQADERQLRLVI